MKYRINFDIDFKRNTSNGLYIAIEGIDGSGKTTQVDRLCSYFESKGKEVVKTREPRKNVGVIGELIQKILHGKAKIPSVAFQYLFTADREIHHQELIVPSLNAGKIVISDRCFWSAIPYGILDRDGDLDENTASYLLVAQSILSMYHQFTVPNYTFYLDISLDTAIRRIKKENGADEIYEDRKKLAKILKGYKWLLEKFPKEISVVDGEKGVEEVTDDIISILNLKF